MAVVLSHACDMIEPVARPDSSPDAKYFAREMRVDMPISERAAWNELKNKRLGVKFRRQVPIGPYVVDFCCLRLKLAIEIDGPSHDWKDESARTEFIEKQGFTILRFTNEHVARYGISEPIRAWLSEHI